MGRTRTGEACRFLTSVEAYFHGMIRIFTPSFADESGTNAQNLTVKEVVTRLDSQRFHVTMLTEDPPDPRIVGRPNTKLVQWKAHQNTPRILSHLLLHLPDIYFFPREGPLDTAFLALRRCLRLRTALVTYVVSGGELDHGNPRSTLARNIREAQAIAGNSRYMTELLRDKLNVEAATVYDGVDRRYFYPARHRRENERLTVLFAGSFRPYKRPGLVVHQASRWHNIEFRLVGQGEELEKCQKLAAEQGCSNVAFLGHLTPQQVGEEMRRADVLFFPSIVEGHPQVLGQAAACGLPAVAMNLYHPDFVIDGETGFLAASDAELQERLDLLLTQPALRQKMSEAAIRHAQQFDWDTATVCWQRIFEQVMTQRGQD
jgi:glycosyltransferase involved in cell wall biosynthesis